MRRNNKRLGAYFALLLFLSGLTVPAFAFEKKHCEDAMYHVQTTKASIDFYTKQISILNRGGETAEAEPFIELRKESLQEMNVWLNFWTAFCK